MRQFAVLFAFFPALIHPATTSIILLSEPYIEYNHVSVWYFREINKNTTQILANGVDFLVPMSAEEVEDSFPNNTFISGRVFSRLEGVPQTNYIFIRKDRVESIRRRIGGRATITLKPLMSGRPAEKIQLVRLDKEK